MVKFTVSCEYDQISLLYFECEQMLNELISATLYWYHKYVLLFLNELSINSIWYIHKYIFASFSITQ